MLFKNYNAVLAVDATISAESDEHAKDLADGLAIELLAATLKVKNEWMPMIDDTSVLRVIPPPDGLHPIALTTRERDTILAALRQRQQYVESGVVTDMLDDIAADSGQPLTNPEIDELCERINQ